MNPFIPANDLMLLSSLALFQKVSFMMLGLVGVVFCIRVVMLQMSFASIYEYGAVIKDIVFYLAMLSLFPHIVKLIFNTSGGLALKISYVPMSLAQEKVDGFFSNLFFDYNILKITSKLSDVIILNLAQGAYSVLTGLLLAISPIIIFMSYVLGVSKGLSTYISTLISLSLWPVVWNLIGLLGKELFRNNEASTLSIIAFWIVLHVLQFFSPIFCMIFLKSMSPSGAVTKIMSLGGKL